MANNINQSERGVVILFAVLLVSVVLTISLGIFNITYRQLVLSSIARESVIALAVADSARNCVMYWDSDYREGPNKKPFGYFDLDFDTHIYILMLNVPVDRSIQCGEHTAFFTPTQESAEITSELEIRFSIIDPSAGTTRNVCASVLVKKTSGLDGNTPQTTIIVDGYNMATDPSDPSCVPSGSNRIVQRTIERTIVE